MSVWLDPGAPATRTRRPDQPAGLDRDRVTAGAVRLLDAEGAARFSMRKLAAALDVTAMSLYWYVDTKDDLLELALDAVFEGPAAHARDTRSPEPGSGGADSCGADSASWPDDLRGLATAYREALVRHPWAPALLGRFLNIGPNAAAFARRCQDVVARSGLPPQGRTAGLAAVFQFVYGFATVEGQFAARCAEAGVSQEEYFRRSLRTVGERPHIADLYTDAVAAFEARGGGTPEQLRDQDFRFALDIVVAGIEAQANSASDASS
ncbi:TetR/AcrR family transcriptional regulator C-terminal domain-containing protein [Streptomyces sp. NPDC060194]|uniref:TetR/AcrR family transcriptional regulator C-terminal domain-containing protein n=1 Tax=Streptomyces sp. NPDC060194 TaxID=3347069 RepID=UPI003649EE73